MSIKFWAKHLKISKASYFNMFHSEIPFLPLIFTATLHFSQLKTSIFPRSLESLRRRRRADEERLAFFFSGPKMVIWMGRRMENHGKSMKSGCVPHFCAENGHFLGQCCGKVTINQWMDCNFWTSFRQTKDRETVGNSGKHQLWGFWSKNMMICCPGEESLCSSVYNWLPSWSIV